MHTPLSVFREKLQISLTRLRSGRPARGPILLCENQGRRNDVALWTQSTTFTECYHINAAFLHAKTNNPDNLGSFVVHFHRLIDAEPGLVSRGTLSQLTNALHQDVAPTPYQTEQLIADLLTEIGTAARHADKALLISVWDLHRLSIPELAVMLSAIHRTNQLQLPVLMCGTSSGSLRKSIGDAAGYGERLFEFVIDPA